MKIKTQLRIFLAGVILIPVLSFIAYPVHRYLTRPEKELLDGYQLMEQMDQLQLSNDDKNKLVEILNKIPQHVQLMLIANNANIIMSTFPEISEGKQIDDMFLFEFMKSTGGEYFYQFSKAPLESDTEQIFLLTRVSRKAPPRKPWRNERFLIKFLIFTALFEIFCVTFVIAVMRTITNSMTLLSKNTERIADGELDVPLEYIKNRQSDNEITNLTKNLDKMRLAIKDNAERRTRFIMGISHDLRTPVAVIKGYTEAMSDGMCENPESAKKSLDIINSKTEQLETMINTLINFVKLNQTDWMQQLQLQKIHPVLEDFAKSSVMTGSIFKRNVEYEISVGEDVEVAFDKLLIQRALENIFSNSIRYTRDNDSIKIKAWQETGCIKVKLSDTGIGIDRNDLAKIFDMFYRATNSRREEGMGIGLSVVKTIINAHGWEISVDSQKDTGTEFEITIPLLQKN